MTHTTPDYSKFQLSPPVTWRPRYEIVANPEQYVWLAPMLARWIVAETFAKTSVQPPFEYSEETFCAWLEGEQRVFRKQSRQPHYIDHLELSDEALRELLFQKTPQNAHDTTFLAPMGTVSIVTPTESTLHKVKFDESGNGNPQWNHNNLYYALIEEELKISLLPPERFASDPRFIDAAFIDPVFQLAIANFPKTYFPEILGMTLSLEWSGTLSAFKMMKLLKSRGIDPKFYAVHVHADNPRNGHGHDIKEAIISYLAEILKTQGESARQQQWQRIYQGWHTWSAIGEAFEAELKRYLVAFDRTLRDQ
jgi:hypothetical protein